MHWRIRNRESLMGWNFLLLLFLPLTPAFGYTDPGSGTLIYQIIAAGVFGLLFQVRRVVYRLRSRGR